MKIEIVCLVLVLSFFKSSLVEPTNVTTPTSTTKITTTKKDVSTTVTTSKPVDDCSQHNKSCEDCVKAQKSKCLYCMTDQKCVPYPVGEVLPTKECKLSDARWGVCWMNFEALIISAGVIGGIIVLVIVSCCIYCCCCRGNNRAKYLNEEVKLEKQKDERKHRNAEKRADRKERLDEIRRKYGLVQDDSAPYQRFDA